MTDDDARMRRVDVRVSPDELAAMQSAATRAGAGLTTWLRDVGMRAAKRSGG